MVVDQCGITCLKGVELQGANNTIERVAVEATRGRC